LWSSRNYRRAEGEHRCRMIISRIAVGKITADRCLAPH
jgi:hypothetical protein